MIGFPNVLNTRQDYLNAIESNPEKGRMVLKELRQGSYIWKRGATLADGDEGVTDEAHKVVDTFEETMDGTEGAPIRVQFELVDDPNSQFYRLGFTLADYATLMGGASTASV